MKKTMLINMEALTVRWNAFHENWNGFRENWNGLHESWTFIPKKVARFEIKCCTELYFEATEAVVGLDNVVLKTDFGYLRGEWSLELLGLDITLLLGMREK